MGGFTSSTLASTDLHTDKHGIQWRVIAAPDTLSDKHGVQKSSTLASTKLHTDKDGVQWQMSLMSCAQEKPLYKDSIKEGWGQKKPRSGEKGDFNGPWQWKRRYFVLRPRYYGTVLEYYSKKDRSTKKGEMTLYRNVDHPEFAPFVVKNNYGYEITVLHRKGHTSRLRFDEESTRNDWLGKFNAIQPILQGPAWKRDRDGIQKGYFVLTSTHILYYQSYREWQADKHPLKPLIDIANVTVSSKDTPRLETTLAPSFFGCPCIIAEHSGVDLSVGAWYEILVTHKIPKTNWSIRFGSDKDINAQSNRDMWLGRLIACKSAPINRSTR